MALSGKVDDVIEIVLCKQALDQLLVADVALHKDMAGVALNVLQVLEVAGVGQLVEVDQQDLGVLLEHIMHKVGTDKTGAAGDKIFFHKFPLLFSAITLHSHCFHQRTDNLQSDPVSSPLKPEFHCSLLYIPLNPQMNTTPIQKASTKTKQQLQRLLRAVILPHYYL